MSIDWNTVVKSHWLLIQSVNWINSLNPILFHASFENLSVSVVELLLPFYLFQKKKKYEKLFILGKTACRKERKQRRKVKHTLQQ